MGDGDCLFRSVLKQLCFKEDVHESVFLSVYLCRMMIVHYLKCREENDNELFLCVRKGLFAYGLPPEQVPEGTKEPSKVGLFSIRSYFKYMIKDKTWGDVICLYLIASIWSLRVTVLNSSSLGEMRIRDNMSFALVVLVQHILASNTLLCLKNNLTKC